MIALHVSFFLPSPQYPSQWGGRKVSKMGERKEMFDSHVSQTNSRHTAWQTISSLLMVTSNSKRNSPGVNTRISHTTSLRGHQKRMFSIETENLRCSFTIAHIKPQTWTKERKTFHGSITIFLKAYTGTSWSRHMCFPYLIFYII